MLFEKIPKQFKRFHDSMQNLFLIYVRLSSSLYRNIFALSLNFYLLWLVWTMAGIVGGNKRRKIICFSALWAGCCLRQEDELRHCLPFSTVMPSWSAKLPKPKSLFGHSSLWLFILLPWNSEWVNVNNSWENLWGTWICTRSIVGLLFLVLIAHDLLLWPLLTVLEHFNLAVTEILS